MTPIESGKSPRLQDTIRLTADGLAKVLGDLETRVMQTVWAIGRPVPARAVHERVLADHNVAIYTVITVLNKLVEKGHLLREKKGDLYHYSARMSEEEFRVWASRRVVEGILSMGPEAVTASLVDILAEHDPERLTELARLVQQRISERNGS
jgi:predicted transcriptional regulator